MKDSLESVQNELVFAQTAEFVEPAESAFDDPAPEQDLEALFGRRCAERFPDAAGARQRMAAGGQGLEVRPEGLNSTSNSHRRF
jgi:hypothetical protein